MKRIVALAALAAGALSFTASAANQSASLSISATVSNNCTISTTALTFPEYDPVVANASANLDGTGGLAVACTKGAAPTIGLSAGSNASGTTRQLKSGPNALTYNLFQDSNRSVVWNEGTGIYTTTAATSKAARNFTVYGRIGGNQDVPAGSYSDTVTAVVNF